MSIFKCKMCGGSLEIAAGTTVIECEYCGTKQTLPKLDDDRRANMYDRANHFRRNNEFDKAMGIYEQILNEDNTDAEAYWSLVLCRYGIEYVEDPVSHKRLPTINRAQYTSIYDDDNYKSALQYADTYQRAIYEAEAKAINEIQKGILMISQKEEPFDVFICYKESDSNGRRTLDSVLATELYQELTREGFKVFFSRITLEDKLGVAYEPYIFAALNSAKVMVVLGTRPENFNAVWVKNEWGRYLALIKNGAKKTLIPAYRDMNPYDLPEEFSHLQAQDMSKLGFMQDLIRGIKKIVDVATPKAAVRESTQALNVDALLKRIFLSLEDGEWEKADDFCEQVLNQDPENSKAYLGKLMVELHVKSVADLANAAAPFDGNGNYQKAVRFADEELATELKGYAVAVGNKYKKIAEAKRIADEKQRRENERRREQTVIKAKRIVKHVLIATAAVFTVIAVVFLLNSYIIPTVKYNSAIKLMNSEKFEEAIARFEKMEGYKDSEDKIIECKEAIVYNKYEKALELMQNGKYNDAIAAFEALGTYKDSKSKITECKTAILDVKYDAALKMMEEGKYSEAIPKFEALGSHRDSQSKITECNTALLDIKYNAAIALMNDGKYMEAKTQFEELGGHRDSADQAKACQNAIDNLSKDEKYDAAVLLMESGKYQEALTIFKTLNGHKDSKVHIKTCQDAINAKSLQSKYDAATKQLEAKNYKEALTIFTALNGYLDSNTHMATCQTKLYDSALSLMNEEKYENAVSEFEYLGNYKDCANKVQECKSAILNKKYNAAIDAMNGGKLDEAYDLFKALGNYKDSSAISKQISLIKIKDSLKNAKVGDYINFGSYEQDNNTDNGKEDIEWLVLEVKDERALVISKYALDYKPYNTFYTDVTWETCTLRKWLNNDFINAAFSTDEKAMIPTVTVSADKNPEFSTNPGNATQDQIFLLSITEVNKYFSSDSARKFKPTDYAVAHGVYAHFSNGNCWWLLRSSGFSQGRAACVDYNGCIIEAGNHVHNSPDGFRPALWIDLNF